MPSEGAGASLRSISVPCQKCENAVRYGERQCASCGATLSRELRDALEARLEASHLEFRELQEHARSAATILLVVGLLHLLVGAFLFSINYRADLTGSRDVAHGVAHLVVNGSIGVVMLGAWKAARHAPAAAITLGLAVWVLGHVAGAVMSLLALTSGLLIKALVFMLLCRGIVAAAQAHQLKRRLLST